MPTLRRFGSASLRMYADDQSPPHFHIVGPDFQVLVRIADLVIMAGEAKPKQIEAAMAWALTHLDWLVARWIELNERG